MSDAKTIKCVILDDEIAGINVLKNCMQEHANLELRLASTDYLEVLALLAREKIDILFLDIHMPEINGIKFKTTISPDIAVIYCSADPAVGSDLFEIGAIDYLVKPVMQSRFDKAMERYHHLVNPGNAGIRIDDPEDAILLQLKKGDYVIIEQEEIDYILITDGEVQVYSGEHVIPVSVSIRWFLEKLSKKRFMQISQSGIVAKNRIRAIIGQDLHLRNHSTPVRVSAAFKKEIINYLKRRDT